ncbi:hypothetical protein D3C73_757390 [compost metagenome]
MLQQNLGADGVAAAVQIGGDAAGGAHAAGHAGQLPYALTVLLHQHAVVVVASAGQAQRDTLLHQEPPAEAPLAHNGLQAGERNLAGGDDLPALAASLDIVERLAFLQPLNPQDAAPACSAGRLDIDDRTGFQYPVQIGGRLV